MNEKEESTDRQARQAGRQAVRQTNEHAKSYR